MIRILKRHLSGKSENSIKEYIFKVMIVFVVSLICFTLILSTAILSKVSSTVKRNISSLVSSNTYQQVMNVDNYLQKLRVTTSLLFADEAYYEYDPVDNQYSDFEIIQYEDVILKRIEELGVLESYSDFCIIYSNDRKIGWIADGTYNIEKGSKIYETFSEYIADKKNEAAWFASPKDNYNKLYYLKRINKNAILVTSFYSREIENVFKIPDSMQGMIIRLVDESSVVLYSTDEDEVGKKLNSEISEIIEGKTNTLVLNNKYLVTSNKCDNNSWRVVCSISSDIVMSDVTRLKNYMYIVSILMILCVVMFGFVIFKRVSDPVNEMMQKLQQKADYDQLSGLLNKVSFSTMAAAMISSADEDDVNIFIMLDMDNFKKVNDSLGHDMGDKVLIRISGLIKDMFSTGFISGRLGGDEFALYTQFKDTGVEAARRMIKPHIESFQKAFREEFKDENISCQLSLSMGVAIVKGTNAEFDGMYKAADSALYESKYNGKNQCNFYIDNSKGV